MHLVSEESEVYITVFFAMHHFTHVTVFYTCLFDPARDLNCHLTKSTIKLVTRAAHADALKPRQGWPQKMGKWLWSKMC
jgi:hypothetical protein